MTEWLDRLAADLVHIEGELRSALRAIARGGRQHQRSRMAGIMPGITISPVEARTLIRGAMPAPIASSRLREPHARMVVALQLFGAHLVALNSPVHPRGAAVAAAADLVEALQDWIHRTRWMEASRRSKTRWPVSINTAVRPDTPAPAEQRWNIDLPSAAMGQLHHPSAALRSIRRAAEPDLFAPSPAEPVTDWRQLALDLPSSRAAA